jgi:CheY-like chemotaxis protein
MNEIISKLMNIERMASDLYTRSAVFFAEDPHLSNFLECLAEDELLHLHLLATASECSSTACVADPLLTFENEDEPNILTIFREIETGLDSGTITKEELLTRVIRAELTEWNEIFIYVINNFKHDNVEFVCPTSKIQAHKKQMEYFFEHSLENGREKLEQLKKLPDVWVENILIVDDDPMVRDLLKALLNPEGSVDMAANGAEALELLDRKYYKLIVSDVDMPVMDGITFFKRASEKYPELACRFLFVSGHSSMDRTRFFSENRLSFIPKPMSVKLFRKKAAEIILSKDSCLLCSH